MTQKPESKESPFVNLVFNIVVPALILSKLCGEDKLGPVYGLIAALAFPVGYGLYELLIKGRKNFISLLGFASTLLTGVIGLMNFPAEWVAVKEAFIPFLLGTIILISTWTPFQLVRKLLYIKEIFQIDRIDEMLDTVEKKDRFAKILRNASIFLSMSFYVSSVLNYVLAKIIVKSAPGTTAFTEELGTMTWMSYPVIVVPSMLMMLGIFWHLITAIGNLTSLTRKEIFAIPMD